MDPIIINNLEIAPFWLKYINEDNIDVWLFNAFYLLMLKANFENVKILNSKIRIHLI
jgi:hypothetical protein